MRKKEPSSSDFNHEFEGKKYPARYSVSSGGVTAYVSHEPGTEQHQSTHIGAGNAKFEASRLVEEILKSAKGRGKLK